jgi:adenosylcobinamide kinase / adenosylcobinamide-phosphate guanylyltransferase
MSVWLVLGGARSGKTQRALHLAKPYSPRTYIATGEARDEEMRARIARHRADRGPGFLTVEEPLDIVAALRAADGRGAAIVVDCLTLWLSNLMERGRSLEEESRKLVAGLRPLQANVMLISNEVGSGIVPENALARAFRDEQGRLNQAVAAAADHAELVVAGLPVLLK